MMNKSMLKCLQYIEANKYEDEEKDKLYVVECNNCEQLDMGFFTVYLNKAGFNVLVVECSNGNKLCVLSKQEIAIEYYAANE